MKKKRIYIDLDGVLCDFKGQYYKLKNDFVPNPQTTYGFYTNLPVIPGAIETYKWLEERFDVWILTRPSYWNPLCYTEKRVWVENHLGLETCRKLILSWDKSLLKGDYLIDDNNHEGFEGDILLFGSNDFPDWNSIKNYFMNK
jgi:5'(3')-deoxyribonucleotidase